MRVPDILKHHGKVNSGRVALVAGGREVTYGSLLSEVTDWTECMRSAGFERGKRVAVLSHTSPEYVTFLFATLNGGGILSPLNIFLKLPELERIITDFSPEYLFISPRFRELGEELATKIPALEGIFSVGGNGKLVCEPTGSAPAEGERDAAELSDDVALVVYTGGYGKRQKGAMLTHENLITASFFSSVELGITKDDTYLSTFPLPFLAGTGRMMKFFLAGATVVIMDEFDPYLAVALIEERRVTHLLLVPQMMSEIAAVLKEKGKRIESLRKISYSGIVPVAPHVVKECMEYLPCDFVQSFAQVESTGVISFLHLKEELGKEGFSLGRALSSVGKESLGLEVSVVDSSGEIMPPGMIGELVVKGPTVMKGYLGDPFLSEEKLRGGCLHTGYVASMDEEGYIYVIDRMQEVIVRGGIIIDPEEVEEVVMDFGGVMEVAVVGSPHEELGEVPVAMVVPEAEGFSVDRLMEYLDSCLASYKIPVRIEVTNVLPRNSQGKILKAKIKEHIGQGE